MMHNFLDPQNQIEKVRIPEKQIYDMNVPEQHINGHAFHTYTLTSEDGSVTLEFKHNVVDEKSTQREL